MGRKLISHLLGLTLVDKLIVPDDNIHTAAAIVSRSHGFLSSDDFVDEACDVLGREVQA